MRPRDAEEEVRSRGLQVEAEAVEKVGGSVADVIVAEAWRWKADLIVLGTHGRSGVRRMVLGSVAEGVAGPPAAPSCLHILARSPLRIGPLAFQMGGRRTSNEGVASRAFVMAPVQSNARTPVRAVSRSESQ